MGQLILSNTINLTHDITYRYDCMYCGASIGPLIYQFTCNAVIEGTGAGYQLNQLDSKALAEIAYINLVEIIADVYIKTTSLTGKLFSPDIFENRCPYCRKYQGWAVTRFPIESKKCKERNIRYRPVIDWRLEQLPDNMAELFKQIVKCGSCPKENINEAKFSVLQEGMHANIAPLAMGDTQIIAKPFTSARHRGAPDLRDGESALGYAMPFGLRWVVIKKDKILRII